MDDLLTFYTSHSRMSDPKEFVQSYQDLPRDLEKLCVVVQSVMIDREVSETLYKVVLSDFRKKEAESRYILEIVKTILYLDKHSLTVPRPADKRFAGSSRDFSLLLCSMLRYFNIPTRLRCGFANYFSDIWEDHWLCEYWNASVNRWVLVDPQLDLIFRHFYHIDCNPLDIPRDMFLTAGEAWKKCSRGQAVPNQFGLSHIHFRGLGFIRGSVLRDMAALNKVEMLPWEYWGVADQRFDGIFTEKDLGLIDSIADLITDNHQFYQMRIVYAENVSVRVPTRVHSFSSLSQTGMIDIEL